MLYIWPLFAFFSAPLLLPSVLQPVIDFFVDQETVPVKGQPAKRPDSALGSASRIAGYAALAPLALAIVQYNTIIHPFTLADNRHYMFYVFRYSILRASWVRFALVPAYIGCGILCWRTLGGLGADTAKSPQTQPVKGRPEANAGTPNGNDKSDRQAQPEATTIVVVHDYLSSPTSVSTSPPSLSTALLWLLTTTLSLMTAPLVEPRYFILPWVFWRLLLPAWSRPSSLKDVPLLGRAGRLYDLRLWIETAWSVAINGLTMYIFITRPFYWTAPDGSLADEGRLQRFMW